MKAKLIQSTIEVFVPFSSNLKFNMHVHLHSTHIAHFTHTHTVIRNNDFAFLSRLRRRQLQFCMRFFSIENQLRCLYFTSRQMSKPLTTFFLTYLHISHQRFFGTQMLSKILYLYEMYTFFESIWLCYMLNHIFTVSSLQPFTSRTKNAFLPFTLKCIHTQTLGVIKSLDKFQHQQ